MFLPVVHWWEGHRATVHGLSGWRRQRDLVVVVGTAQCPALIGHHGPAPVVMITHAASGVSCGHLGGQGAGRGARVGVGVASMVHGAGVVVLLGAESPD